MMVFDHMRMPNCNVRLRHSLILESVLCTIKFNGDGSSFAFTDGKTVYFMNRSDGSTVGKCDLGRPISQPPAKAVSRAFCFSPDSKFLAVAGPNNVTAIIDVLSHLHPTTVT
jgi:WD40 repeat protein